MKLVDVNKGDHHPATQCRCHLHAAVQTADEHIAGGRAVRLDRLQEVSSDDGMRDLADHATQIRPRQRQQAGTTFGEMLDTHLLVQQQHCDHLEGPFNRCSVVPPNTPPPHHPGILPLTVMIESIHLHSPDHRYDPMHQPSHRRLC